MLCVQKIFFAQATNRDFEAPNMLQSKSEGEVQGYRDEWFQQQSSSPETKDKKIIPEWINKKIWNPDTLDETLLGYKTVRTSTYRVRNSTNQYENITTVTVCTSTWHVLSIGFPYWYVHSVYVTNSFHEHVYQYELAKDRTVLCGMM